MLGESLSKAKFQSWRANNKPCSWFQRWKGLKSTSKSKSWQSHNIQMGKHQRGMLEVNRRPTVPLQIPNVPNKSKWREYKIKTKINTRIVMRWVFNLLGRFIQFRKSSICLGTKPPDSQETNTYYARHKKRTKTSLNLKMTLGRPKLFTVSSEMSKDRPDKPL